jgi:hypothetical protein
VTVVVVVVVIEVMVQPRVPTEQDKRQAGVEAQIGTEDGLMP